MLLCQEGGDRRVLSTDEIFGRRRPKDLRRSSAPGHFTHQKFRIMLSGNGSEVPRLSSARQASFLSHSFANSPPVVTRLCVGPNIFIPYQCYTYLLPHSTDKSVFSSTNHESAGLTFNDFCLTPVPDRLQIPSNSYTKRFLKPFLQGWQSNPEHK